MAEAPATTESRISLAPPASTPRRDSEPEARRMAVPPDANQGELKPQNAEAGAAIAKNSYGAPLVFARPPERSSIRPPAGQAEYQRALAATDPDVARALLWRAISLGNTDAQVRLGEMYIYGQGGVPNCEQGVVLLRSAAQAGNGRARSKLGALYATGKCVQQDRVEAYRWLSLALASDPGSEWVATNRQMVWRQMSPSERIMAIGSR